MLRRLGVLAVTACLLCGIASFSGSPGGRRNDRWSVLGPGGGGAQFHPTISPHDPRHVLVSCDMTGGYLSENGGGSWRMFSLRGTISYFVFDPNDPNVIYAQATGLWRSTDAGRSWNLLVPDPAQVTGVEMNSDHADETILTKSGPAVRFSALAVDPADSKTLYAALPTGEFRISKDAGRTWADTGKVRGTVRDLVVDRNGAVYLLLDDRVAVWRNGQMSVGQPAPGVKKLTDVSAGWSAKGGLVVYGVSPEAGITVSLDGGATWSRAPAGKAEVRAVGASLQHGEIAYVSYGPFQGAPGTEGGDFGVMRTADGGRTWQAVWKETAQHPAANVKGGWLTARFGPGWSENPLAIGVSPTNPEICYGTDFGRTMRTTDGGKTWAQVDSRELGTGGAATTGLDVTTTYGVHFDPFDPKRVFISYTDIGLMGSEDGGVSWKSATAAGVPQAWVNTTYWVEFDPEVRGRMWAVMSGTHDLPRPKMWRRTSPSTYQGGVLRSDDGGRSWRPLTNGLPQTAATHVLLDRRSPKAARTLYVAGYGKGVFKSVDGGETWALKNHGIPGKEPFAWRLAQDRNGVLYLVVARRAEDDSYGTPGDGALYRSTDGAETWTRVTLPAGVNGPNGLAIDPADPGRLYLATWRRVQSGGGGIYLSEDAGKSWRNVLERDQHIYDVTIDPERPEILYACGFESSAWRSSDRGRTWHRIPGYNFKWGHRVIPDPGDRASVYITTFGGSVWHGSAAGDPAALEDIATPVLKFAR